MTDHLWMPRGDAWFCAWCGKRAKTRYQERYPGDKGCLDAARQGRARSGEAVLGPARRGGAVPGVARLGFHRGSAPLAEAPDGRTEAVRGLDGEMGE